MSINELLKLNNLHTIRIPDIGRLLREPKVLLSKKDDGRHLQDQIFDLLMDSTIRRGDGLIIEDVKNDYKKKILKFIDNNEPIKFVFQGFPFKCHNPIETLRRTPDLGELAYLLRLRDINETIKQIYPSGVSFTALTEGRTYTKLFGATEDEVVNYMKSLVNFSNILKMDGIISFVDFLDVVDSDMFTNKVRIEEDLVFDRIQNGGVDDNLEQLTSIMMRSLPINNEVCFEDLLTIFGFLGSKDQLSEFQIEFLKYIKLASKELAAKYLAIQNVKKRFKIINKAFSDSLYISTISRNDLYSFHPIHKKTRLFPHHGVPVLGSDKVNIVYFGEIITHPDIYTAVYLENDIEDSPFYYLKGKQHIKKLV